MMKDTAFEIAREQIQLTIKIENENKDIVLNNVLYVFDMQSNLLSTNIFYDLDFEISMKSDVETRILKNNKVIAKTTREGKLFRLAILDVEFIV